MLFEICYRVESEVDSTFLPRHSLSIQVKDNSSESITVRENFKAPQLQSLGNLESLVNPFNKESHEEINDCMYYLSDNSLNSSKYQEAIRHSRRQVSYKESTSSLQALSAASDLMQKLSLRQNLQYFVNKFMIIKLTWINHK